MAFSGNQLTRLGLAGFARVKQLFLPKEASDTLGAYSSSIELVVSVDKDMIMLASVSKTIDMQVIQ